MRSQPLFHADNLGKSLFLAFEIESTVLIFSLKPLSLQIFVKNFYLDAQNSVKYDHTRSQPQFYAAMRKESIMQK